MNTVRVKIAEIAVLKETGLLITVGLGSCVGVALYDPFLKIGGLAHILLSNSRDFKNQRPFNQAKFADTAIPLLVKKMKLLGGEKRRFLAIIAGGSQLFPSSIGVGEKNILAVKEVLRLMDIPVRGEDIRGSHGRTMRFFVATGKVFISTVGRGQKEL